MDKTIELKILKQKCLVCYRRSEDIERQSLGHDCFKGFLSFTCGIGEVPSTNNHSFGGNLTDNYLSDPASNCVTISKDDLSPSRLSQSSSSSFQQNLASPESGNSLTTTFFLSLLPSKTNLLLGRASTPQ